MTNAKNGHSDLVVIGGGPGGYPAAFEAAERGMEVTLINAEPRLGGTCLIRGCIPSKALLHVAKLLFETRDAQAWGIDFAPPKVDVGRLRKWKSEVVEQLTGGIAGLCKRRKVNVIEAHARLANANTVELFEGDKQTGKLTFDHVIIATGSRPLVPKPFQLDDSRVITSSEALELEDVPDSMLVIGGGYIGLEMGTVYAALGTNVTVVELTSGLLPGADRDLVRPLQKRLKEIFESIRLGTKVEQLAPSDNGIVATLAPEAEGEDPFEQTFDTVLVAVGRSPYTENLGLENTAVEVDDQGFIKVDRRLRTKEASIMAIGDVAGQPMLAHKATREAKVAVETLCGEPAEFDNRAIPAVVFTDPEVAWCGLTENEAKEHDIPVQIVRFPWGASGRALTLGRTEGVTKLLLDTDSGRVLGVGICGAGAGELIAEGVLAVETGAVARDLAESIHAHPTLSETLMEAAESFLGAATHYHRPSKK